MCSASKHLKNKGLAIFVKSFRNESACFSALIRARFDLKLLIYSLVRDRNNGKNMFHIYQI